MVNQGEAPKGRRDSGKHDAKGSGVLSDVVPPVMDQELVLGPQSLRPRADGGAAGRDQARKELRELETEYAQLEAAAQMHVNHENDWERRALFALQDGQHDLAKDALARGARHAESAKSIRFELAHLERVLAELRSSVSKLD